ncbi:metallophosphoesterase [Rhizobium cremeum]|uniref:metallophosphoesterase n=1 Tax=Rhizobium cremeum TaxID=2813827 RepID=UPI000DD8E1FF|nr:metallophosphoesterase [Rhizobium cremeum]MCJ7993345.1 metallophosphoesterase [Rhizobium cremeum]MCJ7998410.1 metallophosphoesterase [Rhizobium cremeum]
MISRRILLKGLLASGSVHTFRQAARAATIATDITFLVTNDVHACRIGEGLSPGCAEEGKTDENLLRHIRALNAVHRLRWPTEINGKPTTLAGAGTRIATPRGLIVCGDITDDGGGQTALPREGAQLRQFSERYRQGSGPDRVHYPVYVGLGNHDLDQDGKPPEINWYRDELRDYVRLNHKPSVFFKPPLPAENYDEASDSYSWNWERLHLVQLQRYAGDTGKGAASGLSWLAQDLKSFAADGRPVVLFQHYGWDPFSLERWDPVGKTFDDDGSGPPHWWSDAERLAFADTIRGYNIVAIFHGHEHDTPMIYRSAGLDIVKPTAAYKGGFGIVRITDRFMDVALAETADEKGGVTFVAASSKVLG